MDKAELRQLVSTLAKRDPSLSEATIQSNVRALLLSGALDLEGSDLEESEAHLEAQVGDGTRRRIDIEAGFCVIEIKKKLTAGIERDAIDQLAGYVSTREAQKGARYTGMLTDGRIWKLYRLGERRKPWEVWGDPVGRATGTPMPTGGRCLSDAYPPTVCDAPLEAKECRAIHTETV